MARAAVVNAGVVTNIIEYDPDGNWVAPEGHEIVTIIGTEPVSIGDSWNGDDFTPAVPAESQNEVNRDLLLAATTVDELKQAIITVLGLA